MSMTTDQNNQQTQAEMDQEKLPSPKELLQIIVQTQNKDLLHAWIKYHFRLDIPRVAVCHDHCAPFDFIADYIFDRIDFGVVVANRSGGKTLDFGVLDTLMAYFKDETEIATVGAIQFQAQKGYEYFKDFSAAFPFVHNLKSTTMNKTDLANGSKVQILTGTMSGVNSPHPQLVFLDEIDLMIWQILQQALSMAQSKKGVKAKTILTSTRKFANGPMQRMLDEAKERSAKVYMWCIWEVVEPLPVDDPEKLKVIHDLFGTELPEGLEKKRWLEPNLKGEMVEQTSGYYFWDDVITKYKTLDDDTWQTEWVCSRPGLKGVVYGDSYTDDNNMLIDWTPVGKGGMIYLFEDFGFGEGHPDVVLFAWVPNTMDRIVIFDELYMDHMGTEEIWTAVEDKLQGYNLTLPNKFTGNKGSIKGWVPDPHGLTEIQDRQLKGAPILNVQDDSKMLRVNNGINLVKRLFKSGRLMITDKCPQLRLEVLSYKRKMLTNGLYSTEPEKKDDHGPDALRYGVIQLFKRIARAFLPTDRKPKQPTEKPVDVENKPWIPKPPEPQNRPSTAGGLTLNNKGWK